MLQLKVNNENNFSVSHENEKWEINGVNVDLDISSQPNGLISVLIDGKSYTAVLESVDKKNKEIALRIDGQIYKTTIKEPIDQLLSNMGLDIKSKSKAESVKAPMPGMVLKILVEPGQHVKKGEGLIILEAMKMENILKASEDCIVKAIKATEKTAVEKGAVLIELGS